MNTSNTRYNEKLPMPKRDFSTGRTPVFTHEQAVECIERFNNGESTYQLAKRYNVSVSTIYNLLKRAKEENTSSTISNEESSDG